MSKPPGRTGPNDANRPRKPGKPGKGPGPNRSWPMRAPKLPGPGTGRVRLFGRHAVEAALANPARVLHRLSLAEAPSGRLAELAAERGVPTAVLPKPELDRLVGPQTVHQGLVLECDQLEELDIEALIAGLTPPFVLMALDRVTDPQNVGAVLRSAEVFGAAAVIVPARHAPPETGALAKAASGALERVPVVRAPNLGRALDALVDEGVRLVGLAGEATEALGRAIDSDRLCLVMGAEGEGLRPSTRERCTALARIPMADSTVGSLNVSNAAAIALYAATQGRLG